MSWFYKIVDKASQLTSVTSFSPILSCHLFQDCLYLHSLIHTSYTPDYNLFVCKSVIMSNVMFLNIIWRRGSHSIIKPSMMIYLIFRRECHEFTQGKTIYFIILIKRAIEIYLISQLLNKCSYHTVLVNLEMS